MDTAIVIAIVSGGVSLTQAVYAGVSAARRGRREKQVEVLGAAAAADATGRHNVVKASIEAERDTTATQLKSYQEALAASFERVKALEAMLDKARGDYVTARAEDHARCTGEIDALRAVHEDERATLKAQLATLQTAFDKLRAEVLEAQARAEVAEWRNHALKQECARLSEEIRKLRAAGGHGHGR